MGREKVMIVCVCMWGVVIFEKDYALNSGNGIDFLPIK